MPKRFYKHKLLLDENMPIRQDFPLPNELFDVKHIRDDLHKEGLLDPQVYDLAVQLQRLVVTYNVKHFRKLASQSPNSGVIGVSAHLSFQQIDTKLTALLIKSSEKALASKFTSLSETA
jgi:predicted nuclease of predicted toxin-antitoxin system